MSQIHPCKDNNELNPLYPSRGLHLKPIARINVSVHYPELKQSLTTGGKSISSWDIMERIKTLVSPEVFIFLRVVKNTLEFIRFEGDLENREVLKKIITRLDGKTMKVTGFKEPLKIRAAESKLVFPSKYDWDSYFRDAKNMNEMKAGERPDTIHFQNLPCKWFSEDKTATEKDKPLPSEKLFKRIWSVFGEVKCIDIPVCDVYRSQISTSVRGISTFTFSNDNMFEAYVQYKDYMSFVKAMDALRGCSLFFQETPVGKYYVANIKVDFDKAKHMTYESIRKRKIERERLAEKDQNKKTAEKLSKMEAQVKEKKHQEKEKKESEKNLAKIEYKIAMEERKYLIARRKLEAIRLMDYLFETIKRNVLEKSEKKRILKEKTKQEMKQLEKMVMEKNFKENEELEQDKPSKIRKMYSSVKIPRNEGHSVSEERHRPDENFDKRHEEYRPQGSPSRNNHYNNRYLGDWEVKAKSNGGSEVKISSNYQPVSTYRGRGRGGYRGGFRGRGGGGPDSYAYPHPYRERRYEHDAPAGRPPQQPPPQYSSYRGRGRGFHSHHGSERRDEEHSHGSGRRDDEHSHESGRRDGEHSHESGRRDDENNQVVQHDFSYLDELDRAYEKYFFSITKRHNEVE